MTDAEVTTGLGKLRPRSTRRRRGRAPTPRRQRRKPTAFETWERIEGTIKNNEQDLYLRYEDTLSDVRTGARDSDTAKAQRGAQDIQAISAEYLANHA